MGHHSVIKFPPLTRTSAGFSNSSFVGLPSDFTFYIPMYVPSDAKWTRIEYGNSYIGYPAGLNFADLTPVQIGCYLSDGYGVPTGSILAASKHTGITAPGDGYAPYISPPFDISSARGSDGMAIICYTAPSGSTVGLGSNQQWGQQSASGASVDPLPGGFSAMTNIIATVRLHFINSRRPRIFVAGDSISAGYSAGTAVGKGASAWYLIGVDNDWICDVVGVPLATMVHWLHPNSGGDPRPYFWIGSNIYGADVGIIELGANDLIAGATLSDLQTNVQALALMMRGRGIKKILAQTISPGTSWVSYNSTRVSYNSWLLGGVSGIDDVFDLDNIVKDTGTPTQLNATYSADGDHINIAGMNAVKGPLAAKVAGLL